jgi:hypothetical protein
MKDRALRRELLNMLIELEKKMDHLAETPLRHELSERLAAMRIRFMNESRWLTAIGGKNGRA